MDVILEAHPRQHIFNVGNRDTVTVKEWGEACYEAVGKRPEFRNIPADVEQRKYFPFYNYNYSLDVKKQSEYLSETKPLRSGLRESFAWYLEHPDMVKKKPLLEFIDQMD